MEEVLEEHLDIVEALAAKDCDQVVKFIRNHLNNTNDSIFKKITINRITGGNYDKLLITNQD